MAGDKNTKFFHQRVCQRRKKNNIDGLYDREGEWHTDEDKIATIAEEYYKQLFTSSNSLDMGEVIDSVDQVVTEDMAQDLIRPSIVDEVKIALFQMHPSKAPRLDGMSPFFFQKFWHIIGHDVTTTVLSILHSGRYLKKMNYTHIVLIPKKMSQNILRSSDPLAWVMLYHILYLRCWLIG